MIDFNIGARYRRRRVVAQLAAANQTLQKARQTHAALRHADDDEHWAALKDEMATDYLAAFDQAEAALKQCRRLGDRYPAALARSLATLARIMTSLGPTDNAEPVIAEALCYCRRADPLRDDRDLGRALELLSDAGRPAETLEISGRVLERMRPVGGSRLARSMTEYARHLLKNDRPDEAITMLRESERIRPWYGGHRDQNALLLFTAFGAARRYQELGEHSDFWLHILHRFRKRLHGNYERLLGALEQYWTEAGDEKRLREVRELRAGR